MHTRLGPSGRRASAITGATFGAFLVLLLVGQQFVAAGAATIDPSPYRLPSEDLANLDDLTFGAPPTVAIRPEAASAAAGAIYDPKALGASSVSAFLATVTVGESAAEDQPLDGQGVWIIKMAGMEIAQGAPAPVDGKPSEGHTLTTAYVFLDASSGEFLMTVWTE